MFYFFNILIGVDVQVEYIGYGSCTGYGTAAKDYCLALNKVGVDVAFRPVDSKISRWFTPEDRNALKKLRNKEILSKDVVQIFHFIPDTQRRYTYKRRNKTIGFATFESTKAPKHWLKYLKSNSLVITPSQFCYDSFDNNGLNLVNIPHCLNTDYWHPQKRTKNKQFTFMAIGSWRRRKGWHELCQAWEGMDNCHLKIVTDLKDKASIKFEKFNNVSCHTKIQDMASFMSTADCIVCPTLGEGFGYVGAQALALELPLICTDWSGVKEYANKDTCCLIPVKEMEVKSMMDNLFQFKGCEWPVISPDILRTKMQEVQKNYTFFQKKAQRGCNFVREMLSYDCVGNRFLQSIEGI